MKILALTAAFIALGICIAVLTAQDWQPRVRVYFTHPTTTPTITVTPSSTTIPTATPLPVLGDGCTADCGS